MEKKKNIVLVLLFIIIAVMACFGVKMSKEIFELKKGINTNINENQNNNNNEVNNNQNTNNDQNKEIVNEETITDDSTIKELRSIINVLLISDNHNYNTISETLSSNYNYTTDLNTGLLESLTLSNEIKLQTILRSIYKTYETKINIAIYIKLNICKYNPCILLHYYFL